MPEASPGSAAPKELIRLHIGGTEARATWTLMSGKAGPGVDVAGDAGDLSMFPDQSVVEIYAPHVYQRFGFHARWPAVLREAFRVLIPGGVLRLSIPDFAAIARLLSEPGLEPAQRTLLQSLLDEGKAFDADSGGVGVAFEALKTKLSQCGFKNIFSENSFGMFADQSDQKLGQTRLSLNAKCEKETNAIALNNLANVLHTQGRLDAAINNYQMALMLAPGKAFIRSNYLCVLNYLPDPDQAAIFAEHRKFAQIHEPDRTIPPPAPIGAALPDGRRRLRVGYMSSDFREHAVAYFIEPVLAAHDQGKFELFCYYHHKAVDAMTQRIQGIVANWRVLVNLTDDQIAEQVRRDQIDILVDLAGHTGLNRLGAFARKPAPVQVTWLGYPNTTGLRAMDYRITDAFADPVGMTESFHTEKLYRMPECFSCYRPPEGCPEVGPPPFRQAGHMTFGSFNIFSKITPAVIALWARILRRVPTAQLLLKYRDLDSEFMTRSIHAAFARHGVAAAQIRIMGDDPEHPVHMARYNTVDIGLDPFPYNGTTTTCDALWMGVPVVTLAGRTHVSRVGVSQMNNIGLPELVAKNPDDYVDIAVNLAGDPERVAALRAGMRARMLASPLMDVARFTRNLEQAYESMWQAHLAGTKA